MIAVAWLALAYFCLGFCFVVIRIPFYLATAPHTLPTALSTKQWFLYWPFEIVLKLTPDPLVPDDLRPIPLPGPTPLIGPSFSQKERDLLLEDLSQVQSQQTATQGKFLRGRLRKIVQPTRDYRRRLSEAAITAYETYYDANGVEPSKEVIAEQVCRQFKIDQETGSALWIAFMVLRFYLIIREWRR